MPACIAIIPLWRGFGAALVGQFFVCWSLPVGGFAGGVLWGGALAFANALIAFVAFRLALRQADNAVFLRIVFGSMIARLVVLLGAVWYALRADGFDAVAFIASLLGFYTAAMAVELVVIHRRQLAYSKTRFAAKMSRKN
jgi:hypothetical protein